MEGIDAREKKRARQRESHKVKQATDEAYKARRKAYSAAYHNDRYRSDPEYRRAVLTKSREYDKQRRQDPNFYYKKALQASRYNAEKSSYAPCVATVTDILDAYLAQEAKCKLCGGHESEGTRRLAVDHCHVTGKFRGLLCNKCNASLSLVDKVGIAKIQTYLLEE